MKRYNVLKGINIALVCAIAVAIAYIIYVNLADKQQGKADISTISDLDIYDIYGEEVTLIDRTSGSTVINFWASWCTACINELPLLNAAYTLEPFNLVTINVADNLDGIEKYVNRYDLVFPIIQDTEQLFKQAYGVHALPLTVIINGDGEIIERFHGELTKMEQVTALKEALIVCDIK